MGSAGWSRYDGRPMDRLHPSASIGREWPCVAALTAIGAILRLAGFGRLGIDHFDEGVYASTAAWSLAPGGLSALDPGLIPYAPPGYPVLAGLAYRLFGPSDRAAISVSILAGIATIPLVAWLGRRAFGPGIGAAAAAFATASMPHITFSRMALTDATFLLAWIVAMLCGGRFLERPGPMRAVGFGLAVGIAQLVKYNGWLAGAIVAAAALLGPVVSSADRSRTRLVRTFGWGMVAVGVATVVEAPWFWFVEAHGGYASLLRHQRGYLDGPSSWPSNGLHQLRQLVALGAEENALAILGPILALLSGLGFAALSKRRLSVTAFAIVGLAIVGLILFRASTTWWLGAGLFVFLLRDESSTVRLVGVWWLALSVLTPLYHPYARLWLPLEAVGWLMGGLVLGRTVQGGVDSGGGVSRPRRAAVATIGLAIVAGWAVPGMIPPRARPLPGGLGEARDSLRTAVGRIVPAIDSNVRSARILGRPSLFFYATPLLARRGVAVGRLASSEDLLGPGVDGWAIVDAALLRQEGEPGERMARLLTRWEVVAEVPTTLSRATLLDIDPRAVVGNLEAKAEPLYLLRRRP